MTGDKEMKLVKCALMMASTLNWDFSQHTDESVITVIPQYSEPGKGSSGHSLWSQLLHYCNRVLAIRTPLHAEVVWHC